MSRQAALLVGLLAVSSLVYGQAPRKAPMPLDIPGVNAPPANADAANVDTHDLQAARKTVDSPLWRRLRQARSSTPKAVAPKQVQNQQRPGIAPEKASSEENPLLETRANAQVAFVIGDVDSSHQSSRRGSHLPKPAFPTVRNRDQVPDNEHSDVHTCFDQQDTGPSLANFQQLATKQPEVPEAEFVTAPHTAEHAKLETRPELADEEVIAVTTAIVETSVEAEDVAEPVTDEPATIIEPAAWPEANDVEELPKYSDAEIAESDVIQFWTHRLGLK